MPVKLIALCPQWLDQSQLLASLHGIPPFVHAQLAIDALAVGAHGAHSNDQLVGDLGVGQAAGQQAQNRQLALAERLN